MTAKAETARELVAEQEQWMNPEWASEAELKQRTLANTYKEYRAWLARAHEKLDRAVFDAYSWSHDLSVEELLVRPLA